MSVKKFEAGADLTLMASADVKAGRLVAVSGDMKVAHAGAASAKVLGVAATDAKANGHVLVLRGGVQELLASGVITAGDRVESAADGQITKSTGSGIGLALTGAQAGATALVALN